MHLSSVSDLTALAQFMYVNFSSGLDTALEPDQSVKHVPFIEEVLASATGKDKEGKALMTPKDISRLLGKRRAVARAVNSEFSLKLIHRIFSTAKYVFPSFFFWHMLNFPSVPRRCSQFLEGVWMTWKVFFFMSGSQKVGSRASANLTGSL